MIIPQKQLYGGIQSSSELPSLVKYYKDKGMEQEAQGLLGDLAGTVESGEYFTRSVSQGFREGIGNKAKRWTTLKWKELFGEEGRRMSTEEANELYGIKDGNKWLLKFDEDINEDAARFMFENKMNELKYDTITERMLQSTKWNYAPMILGNLLGNVADPGELTLGMLTGGLSATKYASFVGRNISNPIGRTAYRSGIFAAAESSMTEPLHHLLSDSLKEEYTWKDSAMNTVFAMGLGTSIGSARAFLGDIDELSNLPKEVLVKMIEEKGREIIEGQRISSFGPNLLSGDKDAVALQNTNFIEGKIEEALELKKQELGRDLTLQEENSAKVEAEHLATSELARVSKEAADAKIQNDSKPIDNSEPKEIELNHSTKEESKASDEAVIGLISPELKQSGVSIEVDGKRYSKQKGEEKIEGDPEEIPFVNTLAAERVARDIFPGVKVKTTTEPGVRGYYDIKTGEVYLNPELINTPEAAAEVLIEEIITHKGIDAVYRNKNKTKKLFKKVYADHKEEILRFREENKGLYDKQFDDLDIVVEEWMASKAIERGAISPTIAKTVSADIKRAFGASTKGDMTLVEEAVYRGLLKMRERRLESVLSKAGSAEKFTDEEFAEIKKLEKKKAWIEGEKKRAELKAKKVKELDKQREAIEESERLEKEWLEVEEKLKDKDDVRVQRGRDRKMEGIRFSRVAYHGTEHDFERFQTRFMGTGEVVQAFGWGLYFAENKRIANTYRKTLSKDFGTGSQYSKLINSISGATHFNVKSIKELDRNSKITKSKINQIVNDIDSKVDEYKLEIDNLEKSSEIKDWNDWNKSFWSKIIVWNRTGGVKPEYPSTIMNKIELLENKIGDLNKDKNSIIKNKEEISKVESKGFLYKVAIDVNENEILDWDLRHHRQSKHTQNVIYSLMEKYDLFGKNIRTGKDFYIALKRKLKSDKLASEELDKNGVKALHFHDGKSRKGYAWDKSIKRVRNIVVFNEKNITIENKITGEEASDPDVFRRFSRIDPKQAEKERYTARQRRDKAIEKKIDSLLTKYQEDSANLHKPEETVQVKITIGGKEKTYKVDVNKKLNAIKDIAVVNRHMNALTELPADKRFDYLLNITDYQIGQVGKTIAYKAKLELDLELRNMKDFFKSNSNVRELYKASRGNSKNEDAIKVFNTIQNVFKKLMREHNLEGGRMAFLKEHVIPRVYSRDKILKEFGDHSINIKGKKTGLKESDKDMVRYKQRFINWYAGKLDLKKMYTDKGEEIPSPEDIERSLGGMFEAIVEDGKYQVDPVANSANLANKSAISRKIHFLNAEDDYLHDKLFGSEDTLAAIFNQIEQISTRTAMMRLLGTNPNRMIDELTDMSKDLLDDTGYVKSKSKFNKIASNMKAGLSVIDRSAQVSKFATANRIISNLKIISNLAKMGGLIFTSSSDPALKRLGLSRLEVDSKGVWKTMLNINPLEIRNKADKRVLENNIAMLEAAGDAMVYSRIDVDNIGASSVLSRLQHQFFNLNGMNMWNKWHRESFILGAVKRMGVNSQYSMKDLREMGGSSMLLDAFETSGISDSDWDLIRSVAKHIDRDNPDMMTPANGRGSDVYLTYDMVRNIDPEIVANYLGKDVKSLEVERYINELAGKYGSFLNEQMDSSILTPGVKEKRIINFNEAEGTAISLITKLFAQYKTFPITAWTKMSSKYKGKGLQQYLALASAAGIATAIQMVAMNAREILTGRTARPWDTKLLSEAFLRSGVGGLGVDVLFGIANPEGNKTDVMSFLGGPALNMISDGVDMSLSQPYQSTFGEDTASDSLMRVAKFAKSWMPFNNHPLVKAMVVDPIFNMTADHLNPETLRRTESWYRKRGQKYIFNSPTGNEIPILSDELISGFDY